MSYDEIKDAIKGAPKTWLPGLLVCVVKTSLEKKVFKPGGAARVAKEVEDEALGLPEAVDGGSLKQDGSAAAEKCNWTIEYEIPPLRAIYHAEATDCTELEAMMMVSKEQPRWRIRKMTRQNGESSDLREQPKP